MRATSRHSDWSAALSAARRDPTGEGLRCLIDGCRDYLLVIARQAWPAKLQAKEGQSDLVQQTLIEAFQDFASFEGNSWQAWLAWTRAILLHNLQNRVKYYHEPKRDVSREIAAATDGSGPARCSLLAAPNPTPRTRLQLAEESRLLDDTLAALPPDYREVIRLRNELRLPFEVIGSRLGRTADAAQKLWARAINELARRLRRHQ